MRKLVCIAAIIALVIAIPITPATMTNIQVGHTQVSKTEGSLGEVEIDISNPESVIDSLKNIKDIDLKITKHKEEILWQNKNLKKFFDVSTITGQLIEMEIKPTSPITEPTSDKTNIQTAGFYMKWYKISAKNAWGWTMFYLTARGIFIFIQETPFVFPYSYAGVDWWCGWAWSADVVDQIPTQGSGWGKVYAECGFTHGITGQSVDLWAYIKCFINGDAVGDGGAL
jgi:hypothetical protein